MEPVRRVLILGCGLAGLAVARLARERGLAVLASVRSAERAEGLGAEGFAVLARPHLDGNVAAHVDGGTHVVIAFPPDGSTDDLVAPALRGAAAVTYISSTGVYGDARGRVDDATPLRAPSEPSERAERILAAEACYRREGATVLRCPALYGPSRGLHLRILRGEHRIPGDGSRYLSRIHVADLARFVLACDGNVRGETFVVGDLEPAPHRDVVAFVCHAYGVPMPPSVPLENVHASLRADRRVDASRAIARLRVTFAYPTYREGMSPEATGIAPSPAPSPAPP